MEKFQDLSPEQKRVAIAKDTLKWLKSSRVRPVQGTFMASNDLQEGVELRSILKKSKTCDVCVRGGLFYSYIMKVNNFLTPDTRHGFVLDNPKPMIGWSSTSGDRTQEKLEEVFTINQLALMERAFEGMFGECELTEEQRDTADRFFERYKRDETRFRHILNNIIKNKGEFKP